MINLKKRIVEVCEYFPSSVLKSIGVLTKYARYWQLRKSRLTDDSISLTLLVCRVAVIATVAYRSLLFLMKIGYADSRSCTTSDIGYLNGKLRYGYRSTVNTDSQAGLRVYPRRITLGRSERGGKMLLSHSGKQKGVCVRNSSLSDITNTARALLRLIIKNEDSKRYIMIRCRRKIISRINRWGHFEVLGLNT